MKKHFSEYTDKGYSVIELILAVSIFMILTAGAIGVILQGLSSNRLGNEQAVASQYAAEGIEALRSIKNQGFENLVSAPSAGIEQSGNVWAFLGSNNLFDNKYDRRLSIEDVQRDCDQNIVASGGNIDPNTKLITSTVTWSFSPSRQNTVELKSYLANWKSPGSDLGNEAIMMAYAKDTNIPYFRLWDTPSSSWGPEVQAQAVGGNINYIVIKTLNARNETILATMDVNGNIYVQVWQGLCVGSPLGAPVLIGEVGAGESIYKSFDIAYEKNSNRAIVSYLPSSTSPDPAYRIWDGTNWSAPITVTLPPTTGVIRWIELAQNPNPTSNEIALIMIDSNKHTYGMTWDGANWSNMGTSATWDTTASAADTLAIDVEYEQISGDALFAWGDADKKKQNYRIWNGSSLSSISKLTINGLKKETDWLQLVSRANSNEILLGVADFDRRLATRIWSGSSWDSESSHPIHGRKLETRTSKGFDMAWETHPSNPGKAWIIFTDNSRVKTRQWSGSSWGSVTDIPNSDDTGYVTLKADPISGGIFASSTEDRESTNDELWEIHLIEGSSVWSTKSTIWGGPTSGTPDYFRVDIATR